MVQIASSKGKQTRLLATALLLSRSSKGAVTCTFAVNPDPSAQLRTLSIAAMHFKPASAGVHVRLSRSAPNGTEKSIEELWYTVIMSADTPAPLAAEQVAIDTHRCSMRWESSTGACVQLASGCRPNPISTPIASLQVLQGLLKHLPQGHVRLITQQQNAQGRSNNAENAAVASLLKVAARETKNVNFACFSQEALAPGALKTPSMATDVFGMTLSGKCSSRRT
jgi:hypothetical protein